MDFVERQDALPAWILGTIDSTGNIRAREGSNSDMFHSNAERLSGRPWRWNCWGQDFGPMRQGSDRLDSDDIIAVLDWLERNGYKIDD